MLYLLPLVIKSIPAPLISIVLLTGVSLYFGFNLGTVGDLGTITRTLPVFSPLAVPFSFETLKIILPYSLALSIVGLLETLLTATIVDDMTGTDSNKNKESVGQGIGNVVAGFFGGMAGCAMIGQSVINIKSGGRGRLSSLVAGSVLMFLIIALGDLVVQIPMAVLVGIMIMVSVGTFDWGTFSYMRRAPKSDVAVMLSTVAIVVATHDLSKGVLAGVLMSSVFFVSKISKIQIHKEESATDICYRLEGQLFFASVDGFLKHFDFSMENKNIVIDFDNSHVWDGTAVGAIDKVVMKFRDKNNQIEIRNLNSASKRIVDSLAIYHHENATLSLH
jgi:SulP family sulfate permease